MDTNITPIPWSVRMRTTKAAGEIFYSYSIDRQSGGLREAEANKALIQEAPELAAALMMAYHTIVYLKGREWETTNRIERALAAAGFPVLTPSPSKRARKGG